MKNQLREQKHIPASTVVKSFEHNYRDGETGNYGIEKEFAFTDFSSLNPCQKIGKHSAFQFIYKYGNLPDWVKKTITPEVYDYMIEIGTDPFHTVEEAVNETIRIEFELWKAVDYVKNEFPNLPDICLNTGNLFKQAEISRENIPEIWGKDKKAYLEAIVNRFGHKLTPQGQHDNVSIPEPLISYQYHRVRKSLRSGSTSYLQFKNELYIMLACKLRAYASLIIAISANTPFDYDNKSGQTILSGYQSSRWLKLPQIESSSAPGMLKDYNSFISLSDKMIDDGILIGGNNYMPVRPKGILRLGEMPLSLEKAAWFHDIIIDNQLIESNRAFDKIKSEEELSFLSKLEVAEEIGMLQESGYSLKDILVIWQKDNVRRLLGVPLNRLEVRCSEIGGSAEFEIAKGSFIKTLALYMFCNPDFAAEFEYNAENLSTAVNNEAEAAKNGMDAKIIHPIYKEKVSMREFLSHTLLEIESFARETGSWDELKPIAEIAKGDRNEAQKKIEYVNQLAGKHPLRTDKGSVIVPDEVLKEFVGQRRNYVYQYCRE